LLIIKTKENKTENRYYYKNETKKQGQKLRKKKKKSTYLGRLPRPALQVWTLANAVSFAHRPMALQAAHNTNGRDAQPRLVQL
jgi:hypothetical protein